MDNLNVALGSDVQQVPVNQIRGQAVDATQPEVTTVQAVQNIQQAVREQVKKDLVEFKDSVGNSVLVQPVRNASGEVVSYVQETSQGFQEALFNENGCVIHFQDVRPYICALMNDPVEHAPIVHEKKESFNAKKVVFIVRTKVGGDINNMKFKLGVESMIKMREQYQKAA